MAEYIEREAAIEYLMTNMGWKDEDGYSVDDADEKRNIITDLISGIPVADVKPVVHAHFYVDDGCAYCSNCRNNFKKAILKAVKFCPMCGAQIDGYGGHPDADHHPRR